MLPNSSPAWHLPLLSHCFDFPGAQSKSYSEPATIRLVSYFFQRPRKFCQQSLLIRLLPFTTCSVLKVLLSHWDFHLITTFPNPEVLQKTQLHQSLTHLKLPSTCYDHQAAIPHVSLKLYLVHHPISHGPPICPPSACTDALQTACRNAAYAFWQSIKFGRGLWRNWAGLGMWESACTSQASRNTAAADWKADLEDSPRRTLNLYLWWKRYMFS